MTLCKNKTSFKKLIYLGFSFLCSLYTFVLYSMSIKTIKNLDLQNSSGKLILIFFLVLVINGIFFFIEVHQHWKQSKAPNFIKLEDSIIDFETHRFSLVDFKSYCVDHSNYKMKFQLWNGNFFSIDGIYYDQITDFYEKLTSLLKARDNQMIQDFIDSKKPIQFGSLIKFENDTFYFKKKISWKSYPAHSLRYFYLTSGNDQGADYVTFNFDFNSQLESIETRFIENLYQIEMICSNYLKQRNSNN